MDLSEISLQDVRGGFLSSAEESARRYGTGVIAMLDLRLQEPDAEEPWWTGRWRWRVGTQESGLNHSGGDPEVLIRRWPGPARIDAGRALRGDRSRRGAGALAADGQRYP